MSKTATVLSSITYPKTLPDGVEVFKCSRTVTMPGKEKGDDKISLKDAVISYVGSVEGSSEGIVNFVSLLSRLGPGDDYGVKFVSMAIRAAVANGLTSALTPEDHGDSLEKLPPVLKVRIVDSASAAGDRLETFMRDKGRMPNPQEYKELFADIS